ncbi:conserved hypothetical protein [Anaeromyxobacter dehalogenans 2CP-1]|uniref:PKD domain-containing protein n=1 Tax=Anaeromyxobacter dehalogenans (strain ATCC BAA-258 / DSM 21875 / 2CP-1) TaxID=455488 RepID=B8JEP7_ANAD2|nr:PKD domain-containing protein [Anaeromyxobacter dehalogenans]ACL66193.1 conserved hypothetical protein [Anaeromyxobacter dehalogenans 2CP-1]
MTDSDGDGVAADPAAATAATLAVQPGFPIGAKTNGTRTATTPTYAVAAGDVVLAFVASDAPAGNAGFSVANRSVTGGTLAWTRVGSIANTRNGAVAVYRGTPSAALTGVTTTVTETGGNQAYISVVAIAGASQTLGAVTAGGGSGTAASLTVNATAAGSWILAVGEDWYSTTRRTLAATTTPTLVDERSDPALNDYWVERATTAAAGSFRIGTSAPSTADWNMIAVEVLPATATSTPTPPPPAPTGVKAGFPVATETNGTRTATTPTYALAASDVVLAFVASDAPAGNAGFSVANRSVTGGTLAWTRVGSIANTRNGAVAVYRGTPSAALTGVTTTVTETGGNQAYISVVAIAGASQTLGAVTAGGGSGTAASLTVNATAAGSWILAVGEDWYSTTRRTLAATTTPTLVDERSDPALNDYWVERATTAAAGSFRIGTSAPSTADWNMIAVEVLPATATSTPTPPPPAPVAAQPSINPAAGTYASSVTATITCPTAGTVPYRTTDGSAPTTSSPQSATATFSATGTLNAICSGTGYSPSTVASAAYTITTSTGGTGGTPTGTPMTTAHRTSGVAPLAVFFDAVNTSASGTAAPFAWSSGVYQPSDLEGTQYSWSFGDPGSGTWNATGASKDQATGYTAAHVYETPGTYTVSLSQADTTGTVRTYVQTITVTAFAGTTYYVAASGNDSAAGTSEATPLRTVARAMSVALATSGPVRVLFRRGDTFPVSAAYAITKPGPGIIGAYGSGNRPIFTVAELGDVNVFSPRGTGADWRIMDLDMRGPSLSTGTGPVGPDVSHQGVNLLVLRLRASNWYVGIGWGDWTPIYATPHDGMFVVDSESPGNGGYGMYLGGRRIALLGNVVSDPVQTHVCRVWQAHKGVISNNALLRPGGQRHALKLHGPVVNDGRPETRWVSISDNFFQASGTSQWTVSMGSPSSALSESSPVSHVVFERNRFGGSASLVADIESEASHVMVRNNVFDDTAASAVSVLWAQRNTGVPAPDDVRIYNNTVYDGTAGSGSGLLQTNSSVTNLRVRNNLYGAATLSSVSLIQGAGGAGWAADHNLATSSPGFANAAGGDFSLGSGSPAVDAGAALRDAGLDYQLSARPRGAGYDLGAYESR